MNSKRINSMTGSGRGHYVISDIEATVELRAVNNRYLDFQVKSDNPSLLAWSQRLREKIADRIQRGKVECVISTGSHGSLPLSLNEARFNELVALAEMIHSKIPYAAVNVTDLLAFPGVLNSTSDEQALNTAIERAFDQAVDELISNREHEGERLKEALLQRLQLIEQELDSIHIMLPELTALERDRLHMRLADFKNSEHFDPQRLEQEVVLMAERDDIQEEYDRLRSHVAETRRVLGAGGICGKRLDFMMQEFNRESNTIASKSSQLAITKSAVELKVLIEQMREQVQNIE